MLRPEKWGGIFCFGNLEIGTCLNRSVFHHAISQSKGVYSDQNHRKTTEDSSCMFQPNLSKKQDKFRKPTGHSEFYSRCCDSRYFCRPMIDQHKLYTWPSNSPCVPAYKVLQHLTLILTKNAIIINEMVQGPMSIFAKCAEPLIHPSHL